jgi:DNA-binding SARP family transcriptional activator
MQAPLSLRLFGPMSLVDASARTHRLRGKSARILAVLGIRAGTTVHKDELADAVWDGAPPASYRQTLDSDVCVLRRRAALGTGRGSVLVTVRGGYELDPERVDVDAPARRHLVDRVLEAASGTAATLGQSLVPASGDVLFENEPFWDWGRVVREQWEATLTECLLHISRSALVCGEPGLARTAAAAALSLTPDSEAATVHLMRAQWWQGRHNDALRTYVTLQDRLVRELGEIPQSETQDVYLALLRDHDRLPSGADAEDHVRLLLTLLRRTLDQVSSTEDGTRPERAQASM